MPISRIASILVLACALAWVPVATPAQSSADTQPNVLFILIDTLRPDHLGAYGYAKETSPVIDALAKQGVLFGETLSAAPWTVPSTASIFTSLYPSAHGVTTHSTGVLGVLDEGVTTLAEIMAANGYQTSGIVSNPWLSPTHRLNQGFESYTMVAREDARLVTTEALSWLDRRSAEPFFLYVHFMDVHGPYNQIPSPYNEMFSPDTYPERKLTRAEQAGVPSYWKLSPLPDLRDYVIRYDREIRFVDAEIGRLLARLEALGVREDTLVVVTADHGLEFLEHGGWDMGYTLYDENLRVPLIMVLPAKLPRNRRIESQVRTVDIMPTILGILGIALQHEVQGQDLNPMIARSGELDLDALSEAVYRAGPGTPRYEFNLIKSLRTERFKIIDKGESAVCTWWSRPWWCLRRLREGASQAGLTTGAFIAATWSQPSAGSELYDLEADAGELNDLLEVPAEKPQHHAEEAAQLRQRLEANLTASQRYHSGGGKPLDAETLENLKSLGYID